MHTANHGEHSFRFGPDESPGPGQSLALGDERANAGRVQPLELHVHDISKLSPRTESAAARQAASGCAAARGFGLASWEYSAEPSRTAGARDEKEEVVPHRELSPKRVVHREKEEQ